MADAIIARFHEYVKRDPKSILSRCAYAAVMMMEYGVRVGNEDSAEGYLSGKEDNKGEMVQTYGTTTLLNRHVKIHNNELSLDFLGKEQVEHSILIDDPFLVKYGRAYISQNPEDKWLGINYEVMFDFVKSEIGDAFVPKDLRTFCANTTAWNAMQPYLERPKQEMKSDAKKEIADIIEIVAARLGNTPGVSRARYVDHRMLDWFLAQRFQETEK